MEVTVNKIALYTISLVVTVLIVSSIHDNILGEELEDVLLTADIIDDFDDGDPSGWTYSDPTLWEESDGSLVMNRPVSRNTSRFAYYAIWDEGEIDGDFTLVANIGFNQNGYPIDDENTLSWFIYFRNFFIGLEKDWNNLIMVSALGSGAPADWVTPDGIKHNSLVKYTDEEGLNIMQSPYYGQGIGLDTHDSRQWVMSRSGNVITVWIDDEIIFQGIDNDDKLSTGKVFVASYGPVGIKVDDVSLSSTPLPVPQWDGPAQVSDFEFDLEEGQGHKIISTDGTHWGTIEGQTDIPGSFMGWWSDDGVEPGNKSWTGAAGQLTVQNFNWNAQSTIEGWFKVQSVDPVYSNLNLINLMFSATDINPDYWRERGSIGF